MLEVIFASLFVVPVLLTCFLFGLAIILEK